MYLCAGYVFYYSPYLATPHAPGGTVMAFLSIYIHTYKYICLSDYRAIELSIYLSIYLSINLAIYLSS